MQSTRAAGRTWMRRWVRVGRVPGRPSARRPRLYGAVTLAALSLTLLAASTAGAAVRTEFFGIAQGTLDPQDRQGIAAARVQTARFMLKWRDIERVRGSYDWSERDRMIGGLAVKGIRSVPFVWGSPEWVGDGSPWYPPSSAAERQAWQNFLKAAVGRYGPGGSYWANKYRQDFGQSATPLPIQFWQVWNEPNLKKYFGPGSTTVQAKANKYAQLLAISHDAIKAKDPKATIVLAGMPGITNVEGSSPAPTFLDAIYNVAGVKADFDVAALHPYGCDLDRVRTGISRFSTVMKNRGDGATPLWLTEFAWGSGPPDQFCTNKGLTGQRDLLVNSFRMILQDRKTWNVQRLFWFLWRDPEPGSTFATYCSFCGTAGLLRHNRTAKPAYTAFRGFTAETTRPVASITSGPAQGSFIKDSTPTFSFASNEAGSTFVCRYDSNPFTACRSPSTRATPLANGAHTFSVKAIDAPGNESLIVSRSFTVDTVPPQTTITSGPSGATADTTPTFTFSSSESGSAFRCRYDSQAFAPCSGPGASHTPSTPLTAGSHSFDVTAIDKAKNFDPTPARRTFTVTP
jgi:hypothetical protein